MTVLVKLERKVSVFIASLGGDLSLRTANTNNTLSRVSVISDTNGKIIDCGSTNRKVVSTPLSGDLANTIGDVEVGVVALPSGRLRLIKEDLGPPCLPVYLELGEKTQVSEEPVSSNSSTS